MFDFAHIYKGLFDGIKQLGSSLKHSHHRLTGLACLYG